MRSQQTYEVQIMVASDVVFSACRLLSSARVGKYVPLMFTSCTRRKHRIIVAWSQTSSPKPSTLRDGSVNRYETLNLPVMLTFLGVCFMDRQALFQVPSVVHEHVR
jgi:hypothetical protein